MSRAPGVSADRAERYDFGSGGRATAALEDEMLPAQKISRAQAVALPRPPAAPGAATEWIVAGIAVLLLVVGLLGL